MQLPCLCLVLWCIVAAAAADKHHGGIQLLSPPLNKAVSGDALTIEYTTPKEWSGNLGMVKFGEESELEFQHLLSAASPVKLSIFKIGPGINAVTVRVIGGEDGEVMDEMRRIVETRENNLASIRTPISCIPARKHVAFRVAVKKGLESASDAIFSIRAVRSQPPAPRKGKAPAKRIEGQVSIHSQESFTAWLWFATNGSYSIEASIGRIPQAWHQPLIQSASSNLVNSLLYSMPLQNSPATVLVSEQCEYPLATAPATRAKGGSMSTEAFNTMGEYKTLGQGTSLVLAVSLDVVGYVAVLLDTLPVHQLSEILLLVPDIQLKIIQRCLQSRVVGDIPIRIVGISTVLKQTDDKPQFLIEDMAKLAAASLVSTSWFIALDGSQVERIVGGDGDGICHYSADDDEQDGCILQSSMEIAGFNFDAASMSAKHTPNHSFPSRVFSTLAVRYILHRLGTNWESRLWDDVAMFKMTGCWWSSDTLHILGWNTIVRDHSSITTEMLASVPQWCAHTPLVKPSNSLSLLYNSNKPAAPNSSNKQMTIVLALTLDDAPRAAMLFISLEEHLDLSFVQSILVLVPDSDMEAVASLLRVFSSLPIQLIPDSRLLSHHKGKPGYGIQMMLKLAVSKLVTTDFYLTLDADLVLLRKLRYEHLVNAQGRAVYVPRPRGDSKCWWTSAEKTLGMEGCLEQHLDAELFGVTPAVLSTRIVSKLLSQLNRLYGDNQWEAALWKDFDKADWGCWWTEYSLYRVAACGDGMFDDYHDLPRDGDPVLYGKESLWNLRDLANWDANLSITQGRSNNPSTSLFMVAQSNTGFTANTMAKLIYSNNTVE